MYLISDLNLSAFNFQCQLLLCFYSSSSNKLSQLIFSFHSRYLPSPHITFSHALRNFSTISLKCDCQSSLRSCSSGSAVLPVEESCLHPPTLPPHPLPLCHSPASRHSPWDSAHPFQITFSYNMLAHSVPATGIICPQMFDLIFLIYI